MAENMDKVKKRMQEIEALSAPRELTSGEKFKQALVGFLPLIAGIGSSEDTASLAKVGISGLQELNSQKQQEDATRRANALEALKSVGKEEDSEQDFQRQLQLQKNKSDLDLRSQRASAQQKMQEEPISAGDKTLDRELAKKAADWDTNGKPSLQKNLNALIEARDALRKDSGLSGGLTGALPDRLTADKVLAQRQKVQSAIQGSLKATLGAQFTEKEGERVLKNSYNEAASTKANEESLNRLIQELQQNAKNLDAVSKKFKKRNIVDPRAHAALMKRQASKAK